MKVDLYRKIYKTLNEDLNMILSDDDFEEPEIDLGVHLQNVQKKVNLHILTKNVTEVIENNDRKLFKDIIENQWDGENPIFFASDDNLKDVVYFSIYTLGNKVNLNWIGTSNVTNMRSMFANSSFNGDISRWDVSNVTDMHYMFLGSKFNGDISKWNVSNVKDMSYMFNNSVFNGDISKWNVSKVKDMSYMFDNSVFNDDISKWDVSNVTDMRCMFFNSKFNGDISEWDVSHVTDMDAMFYSSKFNGDIRAWNVSSVIYKDYIFNNCPIKEKYKPKF